MDVTPPEDTFLPSHRKTKAVVGMNSRWSVWMLNVGILTARPAKHRPKVFHRSVFDLLPITINLTISKPSHHLSHPSFHFHQHPYKDQRWVESNDFVYDMSPLNTQWRLHEDTQTKIFNLELMVLTAG